MPVAGESELAVVRRALLQALNRYCAEVSSVRRVIPLQTTKLTAVEPSPREIATATVDAQIRGERGM